MQPSTTAVQIAPSSAARLSLDQDAPVSLLGRRRPQGQRILLAECRRPTRAILAAKFEARGCEVVSAWSYRAAFALLEERDFDLAVLSTRLPVGGMPTSRGHGIDMLDQLSERWPELPILLLGSAPQGMEEFRPVANVRGIIDLTNPKRDLMSELQNALQEEPHGAERRRFPRVTAPPIEVTNGDAVVVDISEGGLCLALREPIAPLGAYYVTLTDGVYCLGQDLRAEVRWQIGSCVGLEWTNLSEDTRLFLGRCFERWTHQRLPVWAEVYSS